MKKSLITAILGLAVLPSVAQADGYIQLYSYNTPPIGQITYGSAIGAHAAGEGLGSDFTVGFYWAPGVVAGPNDGPYNYNSLVGQPFTPGTGTGSTVAFDDLYKGYFFNSIACALPGVNAGPVTLLVVVYNGSSYETSTLRAHSPAFQITPAYFPNPLVPEVGSVMPAFSIYQVYSLPMLVAQPYFSVASNRFTTINIPAGSNALLRATSQTGGALFFQWRHNGTNMPDASGWGPPGNLNSQLYVDYEKPLPAVALSDAGNYDLILTNSIMSITSSVATLSVMLPPPTISGSLSNGTYVLNCSGIAHQSYILQSTPSLSPPVVWSAVNTNTADGLGLFNFTDPISSSQLECYYRLSSP